MPASRTFIKLISIIFSDSLEPQIPSDLGLKHKTNYFEVWRSPGQVFGDGTFINHARSSSYGVDYLVPVLEYMVAQDSVQALY